MSLKKTVFFNDEVVEILTLSSSNKAKVAWSKEVNQAILNLHSILISNIPEVSEADFELLKKSMLKQAHFDYSKSGLISTVLKGFETYDITTLPSSAQSLIKRIDGLSELLIQGLAYAIKIGIANPDMNLSEIRFGQFKRVG